MICQTKCNTFQEKVQIENFNKQIKSQCKKKVEFPNGASLERFICGLVLEYNRESDERIDKGFSLAQAQLTDLFS